jgi:hypothetical protein
MNRLMLNTVVEGKVDTAQIVQERRILILKVETRA